MLRWTIVPFRKYEGKTLPEIIVRDLDWFFWVLPKLYGKLADDAQELARKARGIKIPKSDKGKLMSNISLKWDQGSAVFRSLKQIGQKYSRWTTRLPYLDLSWPLRRKKYDKRAGCIMMRDFRINYFGKHKRLTKARCEELFSNDRNFICR